MCPLTWLGGVEIKQVSIDHGGDSDGCRRDTVWQTG